MKRPINVVMYGLGAVGRMAVQILAKRRGVRIVGAIDIKRSGEDLGQVAGIGRQLNLKVTNDPESLFAQVHADICLHATDSFVDRVYKQIVIPIEHSVNILTSAEEMAQPYVQAPSLAARLDRLARDNGVTVVGTGRAPGFATDTLIIYLTSLCSEIRAIRSSRTSSLREYPLASPDTFSRMSEAFGVGKTPKEFKSLVRAGKVIGHVGGRESLSKIAEALQWRLDNITHELSPIVKNGKTTGSRVITRGVMGGKEVLYEESAIEYHETIDEQFTTKAQIEIDGVPPIKLTWEPYGVGPIATASLMVNQIPAVIKARPGLLTTTDLPITWALLEDLGGVGIEPRIPKGIKSAMTNQILGKVESGPHIK